MSTTRRPTVDCQFHHTTLHVEDVRSAVDFYQEKLGFNVAFQCGDPLTMAGVNLGTVQIFLQQGTPDPRGCSLYFVVGDADELFEFQNSNRVELLNEPGDRPYGLRDYAVKDLYGYVLEFGHYIYTVGEPVEIERVEVPVRLEKRLAALIDDLAEHKRMSLSSCLEEILLHTCEQVGDGVASPHTARQLRFIQELKIRHGIDYDCHAAYRFVEKD